MSQELETKKLTPEELESLKKLQNDYSRISFELGSILLQSENLAVVEKKIISSYKDLQETEKELMETLNSKYGSGEINIETGEIKQTLTQPVLEKTS